MKSPHDLNTKFRELFPKLAADTVSYQRAYLKDGKTSAIHIKAKGHAYLFAFHGVHDWTLQNISTTNF